jgi:hypothetical protein
MTEPPYSAVLCPHCGAATKLVSVIPSETSGMDEITFRCEECERDFKRALLPKVPTPPSNAKLSPH